MSMKAGAGEIDPFLILLVSAVLIALGIGYGIHTLMERRRIKRDKLADEQSRAIAIIESHEQR